MSRETQTTTIDGAAWARALSRARIRRAGTAARLRCGLGLPSRPSDSTQVSGLNFQVSPISQP